MTMGTTGISFDPWTPEDTDALWELETDIPDDQAIADGTWGEFIDLDAPLIEAGTGQESSHGLPVAVPVGLVIPKPGPHPTEPGREQTWAKLRLPEWVTELRPHQWEAVEAITSEYMEGNRAVFLDAPTGTGKSLIGEVIRQVLGQPAWYVCSSKSLQDQFLKDFPYAKMLKGRSNYPTQTKPFPEYSAADCTKEGAGDEAHCYWCPVVTDCGYERAKREALLSKLGVLNTSYLLTEANYVRHTSGRGLVIADECDVLEGELMGFVEFYVGDRMLNSLGLTAPKKGSHKPTIISFLTDDLIPAAHNEMANIPRTTSDVRALRRRASLAQIIDSALSVSMQYQSDNWLRDNDAGPLVLKPVRVDEYGMRNWWVHAKRWLCMSATIISPEEMAVSLGCEVPWGTVRVPMTFPVENRQINVCPIADMSAKHKETSYPKMALAIRRLMELHPDERILVHTVSYDLTRYLHGELAKHYPRRVLSYGKADERERTLRQFRNTEGAVLLAPSLDRGIDLKGDECRVVVVAKVPFPYLGDRQVSARLNGPGGQAWYNVQTVRTLVQMTGRGVRSKDDWCVTYILDRQFVSNVWKRAKSLLPDWWKEAINMRFDSRALMR
jgi:ATP-dependent DNA helicase DinG